MSRRGDRRGVQKIFQEARIRAPKGALNEALSCHAEAVNRGGLRRQLAYLRDQLGDSRAASHISNILAEEDCISQLTADTLNNDRLGVLIRTVYDLKIKEAHDLAHAKMRNVVRFLVHKLGVEKVSKLINSPVSKSLL